MHGPELVARTMSATTIPDQYGNKWQYHSRSDRHSKAACWGILFDLLQQSRVLADHVRRGEVVFGINHEMVDFKNNRKKNLDLVICTPGTGEDKKRKKHTFLSLGAEYEMRLSSAEEKSLAGLPELDEGPVGSVRLALEAKACMTAHVRALPRLYDELTSSHLTVHGAADIAIAAGFVMVNTAATFISPDLNRWDFSIIPPRLSTHKQPSDGQRTVAKILQISRRTETGTPGFDALALITVECKNDGSPVKIITKPPAPPPGDVLHYDSMISRTAQLYDFKFGRA